MVHDSNRNLRLDRRLLHRRGWIPPEELEKELAALPDVSDKGEVVAIDIPAESGEESGED